MFRSLNLHLIDTRSQSYIAGGLALLRLRKLGAQRAVAVVPRVVQRSEQPAAPLRQLLELLGRLERRRLAAQPAEDVERRDERRGERRADAGMQPPEMGGPSARGGRRASSAAAVAGAHRAAEREDKLG